MTRIPVHSIPAKVIALACLLALHTCPAYAQNTAPRVAKKVISYGGGGWKNGQVQEPCILVNPKDASKLIMFYAGMSLGGDRGCLAKAWADVADPTTWHEDAKNPLLGSDPAMAFEGGCLRLDSVVYDKALGEYWIYYTGGIGNGINLATCPAGKDGYSAVVTANIKRHAANPVLTPKGQGRDDGNCVSQGAVFREAGQWYMFYSYRNETKTLPGIRLATSRDGKQWAKVAGPDLLSAAPEHRYIEWHQVYKIGSRYVMLFEGYNGGTRWGANVATSSSLTEGWTKAPVNSIDQTQWSNYSDATLFHVATPAIYNFNDKWCMYFQAARAGEYSVQNWAIWCIECDDVIRRLSTPSDKSPR